MTIAAWAPAILFAAVLLGLASLVHLRNHLVRLKNQVANALASVDAMLKKRHDLIPNLVAAVQGFMGHEREIFTRITELRAAALARKLPPPERLALEESLSRELAGLTVAVENYPQLRSNENVLQLQQALNEAEEQIAASRRFYNSAVTEYNVALQTFPSNLVASMLAYRSETPFQASEAERQVPEVGRLLGR
ncbi:MAG TPA: LemA family protein [Candidatus Polarisedimenticolia bacterium]|jgi:LemA protein|nr:LemA family protein [Candidatus Polarisedimenticolia bacterium]